eukprot:NODE_838_length_1306_cov_62.820207_g615_i0.p1 GENE.NODE_838_length_1306_cov_62.820207_g615_i0~~NODE_838_length_1306_cov_62.820207_g615_i0.p1  ORF type:complete len:371 (+),score=74.37 NODE_838_length_1306_cov_62.820207_g615_i0:54-1166(+)
MIQVVFLLVLLGHAHGTCNLTIGREYPLPNEAELISKVTAMFMAQGKAQYPKEIVRSAHGKTNACAKATWTTEADIPRNLAQGVFKPGSTYEAWARFSNGAGNSKQGDDRTPDARGLAIKLLNVPGAKLMPEHESTTQDFVFISSHSNAFPGRTVMDYLVPPGASCPACAAAGADAASQYAIPNPLNVTYGSLVASVLGETKPVGIKYYLEPCDPSSTIPPSAATNGDSTVNPNFLRDAVAEQLNPMGGKAVCMQFGVQLQEDACLNPIENSAIPWNTQRIKVAKLQFNLQHTSSSNQHNLCENLSFNPWHSLPVHRPAGSLSRTRKTLYVALSNQRYSLNAGGSAKVDPTSTCPKDVTKMLKPKCPFSH